MHNPRIPFELIDGGVVEAIYVAGVDVDIPVTESHGVCIFSLGHDVSSRISVGWTSDREMGRANGIVCESFLWSS